MEILDQLYTIAVIEPAYNVFIWLFSTVGQHSVGLTTIVLGVLAAAFFMPLLITGYFDQQRTRDLQEQIYTIQERHKDSEKQQQEILALLRKKNIRFQSESLFLGGLALIMLYFYPIFLNYWQRLHPDLLYAFIELPVTYSPDFGPFNLGISSPGISLIPAILLFFELRLSYKEQHFLTSFVDRWYAVILPLFVYFLIFWLPSGLSLLMTSALTVSLYLRLLLDYFTSVRHRQKRTKS